MPRHPLASKIFSHEDQLFSHAEKNKHRPMWHFYQQAMVQKKRLEIRPCWVPNPQQGVDTVTMEAKRTLSLKHLPCSKNRNNHMFSLPGYAGVKLLAHPGWVIPT